MYPASQNTCDKEFNSASQNTCDEEFNPASQNTCDEEYIPETQIFPETQFIPETQHISDVVGVAISPAAILSRKFSETASALVGKTLRATGKHLYPWQQDIAVNLLCNNDVLCISGTGSGKTLAFLAPMLLVTGMCLIISPLIALMKDQAESLAANNLRSAVLTQDVLEENPKIFQEIEEGRYSFVFASPERSLAKGGRFWRCLASPWVRKNIRYVVIDEAHLISSWGATFRSDYQNINALRYAFGARRVPFGLFTATANAKKIALITSAVSMGSGYVSVRRSTNRPNIYYYIRKMSKVSAFDDLQWLVSDDMPKTIIYCKTKTTIVEVADYLQKRLPADISRERIPCTAEDASSRIFHDARSQGQRLIATFYSDLSAKYKSIVTADFRSGATRILISTEAFGIGIDIPDIDRVVIWGARDIDLDLVIQGWGRAARDNRLQGLGVLYYQPALISCKPDGHDPDLLALVRSTTCRRETILRVYDDPDLLNKVPTDRFLCCDICDTDMEIAETSCGRGIPSENAIERSGKKHRRAPTKYLVKFAITKALCAWRGEEHRKSWAAKGLYGPQWVLTDAQIKSITKDYPSFTGADVVDPYLALSEMPEFKSWMHLERYGNQVVDIVLDAIIDAPTDDPIEDDSDWSDFEAYERFDSGNKRKRAHKHTEAVKEAHGVATQASQRKEARKTARQAALSAREPLTPELISRIIAGEDVDVDPATLPPDLVLPKRSRGRPSRLAQTADREFIRAWFIARQNNQFVD